MSITRIGLSGSLAAQAALNMSARNTANLLTTGYTRQGVMMTARVGGGVEVSSLIRFADNYKTQQKWAANGPAGQFGAAESYFKQLEEVMGLEDGSVKMAMDRFFGALDEVSADVTNPALRQQVLMAAGGLATSFNNLQQAMRTQLDTLRQQSEATASQINGISESIADLNRRIADAEATGGAPSELIDQRDQAIDQLAALVEIRTVRQPDGTVDVNLKSGTPLVSGNQVGKVSVQTQGDGTFSLSLELGGTQYPLDGTKVGGALGGLFTFAEETLLPQMEAVRTLAEEIATRFNDQLTQGYGMDGQPGQPLFTLDPATGRMEVNSLTPDQLGFSADPNAPGNSDNLLKLIELRSTKITLPGFGEVSLGDGYTQLVGKLGAQAQQNQSMLAMATEVRKQSEEAWLAVSGVNMDEEAVNIAEFMQIYSANMKVISVAGELFDATINAF